MVTDSGVTTTTTYTGGTVYENGSLKFINHAEGYIEPDGVGGYDYVYQYKDHLGNIRLSYSDANNDGVVAISELIEESNYYPFGLAHRGYNNLVNGTHYPYGFNGKEENEELELNWLDFGARNYDATLGRWMNIDPLAEDMRRHSPYTYGFDNPIYYVDPDGMMPFGFDNKNDNNYNFNYEPRYIASTVVNDQGEIIDHKDDGDDNIYLNKRSVENIIGTERDGVTYSKGSYLEADDLNDEALSTLPDDFLLKLGEVEFTSNHFWPIEILSGSLIKLGSWLNTLRLFRFGSRIKANNIKELKALIRKLSKDGAPELTQRELNKLEKLVRKFGGVVRRDMNPVRRARGRLDPHVQIEGLGKSVESRKIFIKKGVK